MIGVCARIVKHDSLVSKEELFKRTNVYLEARRLDALERGALNDIIAGLEFKGLIAPFVSRKFKNSNMLRLKLDRHSIIQAT